jgi:hypothetical protein
MRSRKATKEAIRTKLNFTFDPPRRDQLLARAMHEQGQSQETEPARHGPAMRRMIMRTTVTKLAVAAAIVIAAMLGMYIVTGSFDGTSVTTAQVRQAMDNVDWMQVRDKVQNATAWLSFASKIQVAVNGEGKIWFGDFNAGKQLIWTPGSQDIYESPLDKTKPFAGGVSGPFELVTRMFDFFTKESGWTTTKESGTYEGRKVEVWTASRAAEQPGVIKMCTVYIDVESKLPVGSTTAIQRADGSLETREQVEWSYPQTGPADIYEAGAPRSAQIKPAPQQEAPPDR